MGLVLGVALSAIGATLILRGAGVITRTWGVPATGMAAALLGPIVVLPLVVLALQPGKGTSGTDGTAGGVGKIDPLARCAGVALLNLCLLLPIVVLADCWRGAALADGLDAGWLNRCAAWLNPGPEFASLATTSSEAGPAAVPLAAPSGGPTSEPTTTSSTGASAGGEDASSTSSRLGMRLPLVIWRVDCPYLLLLALFLVPVSLGRWSLSRIEGQFLALSYFAYVVVSSQVGG
jgi:hypothetical protein